MYGEEVAMEGSGLALMEWIGYGIAVIGVLVVAHYVWQGIKSLFKKIANKD
jgi:hypothetical protein